MDTQPPHLHGPLPVLQPLVKRAADRLDELRISHLSYRHPESGRGIEQVSLTLRKGEFVVITGRIGSGKSVLVQTLLGLLPKKRWLDHLGNGQTVGDPASFFTPPRVPTPRRFPGSLAIACGRISSWACQ